MSKNLFEQMSDDAREALALLMGFDARHSSGFNSRLAEIQTLPAPFTIGQAARAYLDHMRAVVERAERSPRERDTLRAALSAARLKVARVIAEHDQGTAALALDVNIVLSYGLLVADVEVRYAGENALLYKYARDSQCPLTIDVCDATGDAIGAIAYGAPESHQDSALARLRDALDATKYPTI